MLISNFWLSFKEPMELSRVRLFLQKWVAEAGLYSLSLLTNKYGSTKKQETQTKVKVKFLCNVLVRISIHLHSLSYWEILSKITDL